MSLRREDGVAPAVRGGATGRELADLALAAALDKKALEPVLLDVGELCSYADYILIVSARSDRQVGAICDAVLGSLKERGQRPLGTEGETSGQWGLLDFGDVIVHVFHHPTREFYDLESLWSDAPRVPIDIPDDARIRADEPIY
ncbi:MAG: ribosome silencing factor [Deltaproteobacteria bacterium]|nr:MAG: ribosome silencing factor [Deltaproteobacteria bacterium]